MPTNTVEIINAVAGLWKLVLAVAIIVAILVFRKSLHKTLSGLKNIKYKKGETEVTLEGGMHSEKPEIVSEGVVDATQAPEKQICSEESPATENKSIFSEMYTAFSEKRIADAEDAFERLQQSKDEESAKLINESIYLYFRYKYANDASAISKLETLAENDDSKETVFYWIAACHELSRNYPKAVNAYKQSLAAEITDEKRALNTVALAKCLIKTENTLDALKELSEALSRVTSTSAKAQLYQGIADVYEANENYSLRAIALQKVLEFTPESTSTLFSAAYAQSNADFSSLSAVNYNTLLRFSPEHTSALNNLGVECERLGLPMKCVAYYKQAVDLKETLAMSNLANKYIHLGFEKEAQDLLDLAMNEKNPHKNVGHSLASLADSKEKEDKEWEAITSVALKQQQFYWEYAAAYFENPKCQARFVGTWEATDGHIFNVTQENENIDGKWESDRDGENFYGKLYNRALQIKYRKKTQNPFVSITNWDAGEDGFAYLNCSGEKLHILVGSKKSYRYINLIRVEGTEIKDAEL